MIIRVIDEAKEILEFCYISRGEWFFPLCVNSQMEIFVEVSENESNIMPWESSDEENHVLHTIAKW